MHATDLGYTLLGPVRVLRGDASVPLSPQQQAVLAMLLGRRGRPVSTGELVDGIWGAAAPRRALSTLQTQIGELRRKLEPDRPPRTPARVLRSEHGGYLLKPADGSFDVALHEELVARADRSAADGDPRAARRQLDEALGLWHGQPLAGVPGPYAEGLRATLAESRLAALETRFGLDLALGAHAEAVPGLSVLVAEHPLREGLQAHLMLALYRSGRQAEALAVYADVRRLLADELGVEPGPALTELHLRVLHADPVLGHDAARAPAPRAAGPGQGRNTGAWLTGEPGRLPVPAQLPAPPADFTGRDESSTRLLAALDGDAPHVVLSAVSGIGGVGKTALALHTGHQVRGRYPDGQLHADLLGASAAPAEPSEVLARFLRALGAGPVPEGLEERAALYRSALAGRRVLVVLDNAADERQVAPLLPSTPGCAALVTSRTKLLSLPVRSIELDVFTQAEALELLGRMIGQERVEAEPDAAAELIAACGHLPLAVRIVGARLAQRPGWTIADLAGRLADERRRLDQLKVGDLAVEASFQLSYDQLTPELARVFRLLAVPEGPLVSVEKAAAVLDRAEHETLDMLEQLVDAGLLESHGARHYRCHDLLRLFARARSAQTETPAELDAALGRLVDYSLATVSGAYRLARPGCAVPHALARTKAAGTPFSSAAAGQEWVREEFDAVLSVLRRAAERPGMPIGPAADLLLALDPFGESDFLWPRLNGPAAAIAQAAVERSDSPAQIRARYMLAGGLWQVGRVEDGAAEVRTALELSRATGDEAVLGQLLNVRALLEYDDPALALALLRESTAVHIRRGNLWGELESLNNTAGPLRELGRGDEALALLADALRRAEPLGWTVVRVYLQQGHARTLGALGRHEEALESYTEALEGCRAIGSEFLELMVELRTGITECELGGYAEAAAHLERSLAGARILGHEPLQAMALGALGRALTGLGRTERAEACALAAREIRVRLGLPVEQETKAAELAPGEPGEPGVFGEAVPEER
ncbi:AfsR/SARP family transcriptional regulator [Streptomyces sp. NPDC050504]|uniref:AfsR/SARP family transcriptional regulator n=1 Tax=Streptomyces sp. NPDC050504 TaxID=3365618 RepID=UPI0037BD8EF5